jgi:hypothetical protein
MNRPHSCRRRFITNFLSKLPLSALIHRLRPVPCFKDKVNACALDTGPWPVKELPESANCEALANLCLTVLSGLTFRVLDGAPPGLLFRSIGLFVAALGFRMRRTNLSKARN